MAILPPTTYEDPFDVPFDVNFTDYAIGGKLVHVRLVVSDIERIEFQNSCRFREEMKDKLAMMLVKHMLEKNLIEFTHLPDMATGDDILHARCYLAPDAQVKVMRTYGKLQSK